MNTLIKKPNIAIDTQYDSRSDVTTHSILFIHDKLGPNGFLPNATDIIFKWPFNGRHYLTPNDITFLNRQALKILRTQK